MSAVANAPSPATLAMPLLWAWLEQGRDLLAITDRDGCVAWANERFRLATGLAADGSDTLLALAPLGAAGHATRATLALALRDATLTDTEIELRSTDGVELWIRARVTDAADRLLWNLSDVTAERLQTLRAQRLAELLEMAQEFGRLGIWERQIPSGEGRWDRHVFGFWGLEPQAGTPDFAHAIERIHPDDRKLMNYRESTRQAGRYSQHYRVLQPDGSTRWIHSQWEVKNSSEGQPVRAIGIMMDDTEVYNSAHALSEASAQLQLALDLGKIAVWRHDLKTQRLHYNDGAFALVDVPVRPDGVTVDEVQKIIHPDDLRLVIAASEAALHSDHPTDVEARYRHSDGSWRHLLTRQVAQRGPRGEALAFLGVALDVTDHHDALTALREASERAALITRQAGIGTWESDCKGDAQRWDEQMFRLRGLEPCSEAPDRAQRLALLHPEDLLRTSENWPSVLDAHRPGSYEFRVRQLDGSYRWLASRSVPVLGSDGQPVSRVGVNWDVTESKSAELARRQAALAEQEIQAKAQFLSRMSHELRTPLNAVLGFTQLLQIEAGKAAAATQLVKLAHIRSAGEHLLSLINDVLDLSNLESGELQLHLGPVELTALVADVRALVEPLAAQQRVVLQVGATRGVAHADPTRLRQVLLNLLSNAVKYNRRGGHVLIETRIEHAQVVLTVTDTGRGLTPEQLTHLFEPFNRLGIASEGVEGVGIGLTIVKALVEGMGGSITASSRAGEGTRFEVTLPAHATCAAQPSAPCEADAIAAPRCDRPGQLLYIEDNSVNVLLVEELVRSLSGLCIVSEPTGTAGVERARVLRPDAILIDLQLPDFDGFEVLRRLRAQPETATTPCIALSANALPEDIERGLDAGFSDYWTKPINFKTFLSSLEKLFPSVSLRQDI